MKKIAALLLVLMLVAASSAFADAIPGLEDGMSYAYEVLIHGGSTMVKADPFAKEIAKEEDRIVSIVSNGASYKWKEEKRAEKKKDPYTGPVNIYEISLEKMPEGFLADHKAVDRFGAYLKEMG